MFVNHFLPVLALAPDADRYAGDPATDVFSLKEFREITFILQEGAGGTGTATITIEECDGFTPSEPDGAVAIPFRYQLSQADGTLGDLTDATAAGVTTGANKIVSITVHASALSDGFPFVRLQLTEVVNDPVDAGVVAILGEPRYNLVTAIQ
jgi:hypothetical protein